MNFLVIVILIYINNIYFFFKLKSCIHFYSSAIIEHDFKVIKL